jgi:hypothetical protein
VAAAPRPTDIGLGHIPHDLPRDQNGWIILFREAQ